MDGTGLQPAVGGLPANPVVANIAAREKRATGDIAAQQKIIQESQARQDALTKQKMEAGQPIMDKISAANQNAPAVPTPTPMPEAPPTSAIDPQQMHDTVSTLMGLAALGGALTRTPLSAALGAFASGVDGYVAGNQQKYLDGLKDFEAKVKVATGKNKSMWDEYNALKEKHGADIAGLQNDLKLLYAKYDMPIQLELTNQGRAIDAIKLTEQMYNMSTKADTAIEAIKARTQAHSDAMATREAMQGTKGWQVFQNKDGSLVRVNSVTGETQPIEGSQGLTKPGAAGAGAKSNVRTQIVQAASKNAIDRLNEIKTPDGSFPTTSVMFGQHGTGAISRGIHSIGQSALSTDQQKIDAGYASLVDEAIPVFTGGLRGSDAFRQFLLGQVPQPGDDPETAKEKMRLFEANIKGTMNTFGGMYAANPSFQAPGGAAGGQPQTFSSEAAAAAAGLQPGTKVIINGVSGTWH